MYLLSLNLCLLHSILYADSVDEEEPLTEQDAPPIPISYEAEKQVRIEEITSPSKLIGKAPLNALSSKLCRFLFIFRLLIIF